MTNKARNIAYLQSQTVAAMITLEGMKASNAERARTESAPAYNEAAFFDLIDKYGLHRSAVIATLNQGM